VHVLHRAVHARLERSRRLADVVREAEQVVRDGMGEVVLLGQTVNSYHDGTHDFADLLRAVGAVDGVRRIRFTSPHPNDFSERVVAAIAEVPQVCEHVHLPMQSGSTRVLKRMLRRYTADGYRECVARLRAAVPGLNLTTDIIVGFPGETEEDFEETLALVREIGFEDAYTFKFSPRDGTPATRMDPATFVPTRSRASGSSGSSRRCARGARDAQPAPARHAHEVLVEKAARRGEMLQARTRDFKTVMVPAEGRRGRRLLHGGAHGDDRLDVHRRVVRDDARRSLPLPMADARLLSDGRVAAAGGYSPNSRAASLGQRSVGTGSGAAPAAQQSPVERAVAHPHPHARACSARGGTTWRVARRRVHELERRARQDHHATRERRGVDAGIGRRERGSERDRVGAKARGARPRATHGADVRRPRRRSCGREPGRGPAFWTTRP
jgi:hypothetical protein